MDLRSFDDLKTIKGEKPVTGCKRKEAKKAPCKVDVPLGKKDKRLLNELSAFRTFAFTVLCLINMAILVAFGARVFADGQAMKLQIQQLESDLDYFKLQLEILQGENEDE